MIDNPGLQFQASLSPPAADMPAVGIFKLSGSGFKGYN